MLDHLEIRDLLLQPLAVALDERAVGLQRLDQREYPADVLYLGTETGLYLTLDRGKTWTRVRANLPTVPVYEITLHPRDNAMLLATHGRGIWILDDLTPFQEAGKAQLAEAAHVYTMAPAYQQTGQGFRYYSSQGDMQYIGPNPPLSAPISYWLKSKADSLRILIKDGAGNLVRELKGDDVTEAMAAGMNSVAWDYRIEPIPAPKGAAPAAGGFFGGRGGGANRGTQGPWVLPGDFKTVAAPK